jgi:hypothetical protein
LTHSKQPAVFEMFLRLTRLNWRCILCHCNNAEVQEGIMPRRVHGCSAAWLHFLAVAMFVRHYVVLASVSAEPLIGLSSASLQELRQLQQNVTPDCGLAFQPCCPGEESCLDEEFSCIAREPIARCEPCGTPFSQPCPQAPYCEASELIPTTSTASMTLNVISGTLQRFC